MAIAIERQGQRVYLMGDTFAVKDRIKSMGGHWDGDRRAWWVGAAKLADAEKLVAGLSATPAADAKPAKQDPADIRLSGKGKYKGRTYYIGTCTRDGSRVRLLTLPDAKGDYLDFWADASEVETIKTYEPREVWDGRRYSNRKVTQYTTLGSIAAFVAREQRNRAEGGAVCAACGTSGELVTDLEDGLRKHRRCCDIEP